MSKTMTPAQVIQAHPLSNRLLRVFLKPEHYIDYDAGQYLKIISSNPDEKLYYSIANAPLGSKTYELHIRHEPHHDEQQHLIDVITKQGQLIIHLPFGHCTIRKLNLNQPILFIAGGTGFAPIKAMIEQLLVDDMLQPFVLYWCASTEEALYLDEKVQAWNKHVTPFRYMTHISQHEKAPLIERILQNEPLITSYQVVLAGPFDFVYALRDTLLANGLSQEKLFSDAFDIQNTLERKA